MIYEKGLKDRVIGCALGYIKKSEWAVLKTTEDTEGTEKGIKKN